jgi:hypothetical protein
MKLYKVFLRGMRSSACSTVYGESYVVADNSDAAYKMVREYLDNNDIGFQGDRVMGSVELLAEEGHYPPCRTMLFIQGGSHDH